MPDLQALSDLLDQEWDPIGVYDGPREEHFPPGEYSRYAAWIHQSLRKGGRKADILDLLRQARGYMGTGPVRSLDENVAEVILEWWRTRPTH